jgi:DNA-binding transcriptional LysR family regulator
MSLADPLPGRDLAAFVTALESGTVQGAADALQLTQSAATKRLQALERRVGCPLVERGAHGLRPTAAGGVLYPLAREALASLERAEAAVTSPDIAPLLRIHASRTVGVTLLPEWLASFRATARPCRVSATIANSEQVVHAVRDGAAEIGFVEGPAAILRGLRELVVAQDEICVIVASDHRWARRRAVAPTELTGEQFLGREAGSGTRAVATARLADAGVELQRVLEVTSGQALKRAILAGGFTLLSERVVADEVAAGTLAAIPVSGVDLRRALRAIRRVRPAPQGPARAFWLWLSRTLAPRAVAHPDP